MNIPEQLNDLQVALEGAANHIAAMIPEIPLDVLEAFKDGLEKGLNRIDAQAIAEAEKQTTCIQAGFSIWKVLDSWAWAAPGKTSMSYFPTKEAAWDDCYTTNQLGAPQ